MVESTALEMRRTGNRTVGSNPTLSAIWLKDRRSGVSIPGEGMLRKSVLSLSAGAPANPVRYNCRELGLLGKYGP